MNYLQCVEWCQSNSVWVGLLVKSYLDTLQNKHILYIARVMEPLQHRDVCNRNQHPYLDYTVAYVTKIRDVVVMELADFHSTHTHHNSV